MKKVLLLVVFSLVLIVPGQSLSFNLEPALVLEQETGSQQEGYQDGVRRAENDVSSGMWIAVGCLTGGFSWLYPEIFTPAVPESPMIGRSSEYAAGFRDGYNEKRKQIVQRNSCIGGGISLGLCAAYYIVWFLIITN